MIKQLIKTKMDTQIEDLSPKHQKFVQSVAAGNSATEAAKHAGYSETSAHTQGSRLKHKPVIRTAINLAVMGYLREAEIEPVEILKKYNQIMNDCSDRTHIQYNLPAALKAGELLGKACGFFNPQEDRLTREEMKKEQAIFGNDIGQLLIVHLGNDKEKLKLVLDDIKILINKNTEDDTLKTLDTEQ